MPTYEYYCEKCHTKFEERYPFNEIDTPTNCPKCKKRAKRLISNFSSKIGTHIQLPSESNDNIELILAPDINASRKANKWRISKRSLLGSLVFMLFMLLLVTMLMPKSEAIGISLQVMAGVVFLVTLPLKTVAP